MNKLLSLVVLVAVASGCCIDCRSKFEETHILRSDNYVCFKPINAEPGNYNDYLYYNCNYRGGPWRGCSVYPGTRMVLNYASLFSYSSPASGDYMMGPVILMGYPIVLCSIPIQFCIDTVMLPWDIYNAPVAPEGYIER